MLEGSPQGLAGGAKVSTFQDVAGPKADEEITVSRWRSYLS